MNACSAEPVSWLRLERYALGELPDPERAVIARHLAACPACSECFARIEADDRSPQRALPALARVKRAPRWLAFSVWVGLASAAAALLLLSRPALEHPPARLQIKGGAFALELVRLDGEGRVQAPTHFSAADRFKALVTCPPAWRGFAGVVVYQDGKIHTPLPARALDDCGNRRELPGAFWLEGSARALVCVCFASSDAEWRARVAGSPESPPEGSVCAQLEPVRDEE